VASAALKVSNSFLRGPLFALAVISFSSSSTARAFKCWARHASSSASCLGFSMALLLTTKKRDRSWTTPPSPSN
jgi:hypothetical protein